MKLGWMFSTILAPTLLFSPSPVYDVATNPGHWGLGGALHMGLMSLSLPPIRAEAAIHFEDALSRKSQ